MENDEINDELRKTLSELKEHLEKEFKGKSHYESLKLKAEIEAIRMPFYKKAEFYATISPILLGLIGVFFSWTSGFFETKNDKIDAENKYLDARKTLLENEIIEIERKKLSLDITFNEKSDSLEKVFNDRRDTLNKDYISKGEVLKKAYTSQVDSVVKVQSQATQRANEIIKKYKIEDNGTRNYIQALNSNIASLTLANAKLTSEITTLKDEEKRSKAQLEGSKNQLGELISDLKYVEARGKITTYLIQRRWVRVGFNRIRKEIDPSYDDAFLISLVKRSKNMLEVVTLTDPGDTKGIAIAKVDLSNLSVGDLINKSIENKKGN